MSNLIFSKLSGKADSTYRAVEGVLTEIIQDTMTAKNNDDEVLNAIFNVKSSKKFGERMGGLTEFSNFLIVDEGEEAADDDIEEGFGKFIEHFAFMKSFKTTHEMAKDANIDIAKMAATNFVNAYKRSKLEYATLCLVTEGDVFTYGGKLIDKSTGDGMGLFSKSHPAKKASGGASQSNVFTNALGTDIHMLNRLANIGRNFRNDSGVVNGYTFDTLIIPGNTPDLEETANRIIGSNLVVGSANNDINTQKGKWRLVVNHRWQVTGTARPYIIMSSEANKALRGNAFWNRENLDIMNEIDIKTRNLIWNGYCRFSCGFYNWRHIIMGGASSGTTLS